MGWTNKFHCEWNPFGQKVLNYYWPEAESYSDITKTDFSIWKGKIDILTGGFPCQPYSTAGKRLGKEDERHLWPEMLRAIREIQPRYVVGENVSGLVNWNGGMVFEEVQAELEAEGYEVRPFILPACAVNAPHRRDRVWFVAYSTSNRRERERQGTETEEGQQPRPESAGVMERRPQGLCNSGIITNSKSIENIRRGQGGFQSELTGIDVEGPTSDTPIKRLQEREQSGRWSDTAEDPRGLDNRFERSGEIGIITDSKQGRLQTGSMECKNLSRSKNERTNSSSNFQQAPECISSDSTKFGLWRESDRIGESGFIGKNESGDYWQNFPTQSPIRSGNDGFSSRLDGIAFSKWRNESIKAGGNAIVPQVALQIFKAIEEFEKINK